MEVQQKRHCWECRRRCLVCDFAEPACRRCSTSGVDCPGYNKVKPRRLIWLAPGRVVSRGQSRTCAASDKSQLKKQGKGLVLEKTAESLMYLHGSSPPIISMFKMSTWACTLAEGAEYFNTCMYQDLLPLHEFGQNPHVYKLSSQHLSAAVTRPKYVQYGTMCMILSHRMNQLRDEASSKELAMRFYSYWGVAVRSLYEHLEMEDGHTSNMMIAGILSLMLADVQHGTSLDWRCHLDGVYRLIALRGGFRTLADSQGSKPLLFVLWSVAVLGNTTCAASDLVMTETQLEASDFLIERLNTAMTPVQMCPLPLFAEIIKINHLRKRATDEGAQHLGVVAYEILSQIQAFEPDEWVQSKATAQADWLLISRIYQQAVALYCLLSLQSLSVFPETPVLRAQCAAYGESLHSFLSQALSSPKIARFMIWPLVLLGVEAIHTGESTRKFVTENLLDLSRKLGVYVPLMARRVLEKFWRLGETRWDMCFDRPYVFTSQLAVDTSRLPDM